MAKVRRSVTVAVEPEVVWEVLSDPRQLPRWWPGVVRIEGVSDTGFTEVLSTKAGRTVRFDFYYNEVEAGSVIGWEQEIAGTPFQALLSLWRTRFVLEPADPGTYVRIEEEQHFRTGYRTGAMLQRRAARRRLDAALTSLAELFST